MAEFMDVTVNDIALRCAIQSVQIDRLNDQLAKAYESNMELIEKLAKAEEALTEFEPVVAPRALKVVPKPKKKTGKTHPGAQAIDDD